MNSQYYIGIMSGTSMDGADATLIRMGGTQWWEAAAHAFIPYSDSLRQQLLDLQDVGVNELCRNRMLAQTLSRLYAQTVGKLLHNTRLMPAQITAVGCHGRTVRHAPEHGYSIQLTDLSLLAELNDILTVGDFRSRDTAAGGQGAPLVPAFHQALSGHPAETRVVLNIGGISNISILSPDAPAAGSDTGPGNMLMDAWMRHVWQLPYDQNGEKAAQGQVLSELFATPSDHPYFSLPHPKNTGHELFSPDWFRGRLKDGEQPEDILKMLLEYTAQTVFDVVVSIAPDVRDIYVCGGGIRNGALTASPNILFTPKDIRLHSTAELGLDPQWVEAVTFGWLAACQFNRLPGNPHRATGASKPCILGMGYYA